MERESNYGLVGATKASLSNSVVPRNPSEIEQEFGAVNRSLDVLGEIISDLENKLIAVMSEPVESSVDSAKNPSRQSPIAQNLQSLDANVGYKVLRLKGIINRIQL